MGTAEASISITIPWLRPNTASPLIHPTSFSFITFFSIRGLYCPNSITHSTSFLETSQRPSTKATPPAICTIFTASLPLEAYLAISRSTSFSILNPPFNAAFLAILAISSTVNGLKKISTHLDLMAGGMSSGVLVVAPTSLKSAGSPFWNTSCIWDGIL